MKPPPDEKVIETLRDATQPRQARGKWRFVTVFLVAIALLLVGTFAVVDFTRQSSLQAARAEADDEARAVRAQFAHVEDWGAWYRDRFPENWGGDKFEKWADAHEPISNAYPDASDWESSIEDALFATGLGVGPPPDTATLRQFLADTESYAELSQELLKYDCLSPAVLDGSVPAAKVIPRLTALRILYLRILVLYFVGDTTGAWQEVRASIQAATKFDRPSLVVEHMVFLWVEQRLHYLVEKFLISGVPPVSILEEWSNLPSLPADIDFMLVESELAWLAQVTVEENDWSTLEDYGEEQAGRFSYLDPTLGWDNRKKAFSGPIEVAQFYASYIREARAMYERTRAGGSLREWSVARHIWAKRCAFQNFLLENLRERTRLFAAIRHAESDSTEDLSNRVATIAGHFPHFEMYVETDGWVVRLRNIPEVTDILNLDENELAFYERHPPTKLKRLK